MVPPILVFIMMRQRPMDILKMVLLKIMSCQPKAAIAQYKMGRFLIRLNLRIFVTRMKIFRVRINEGLYLGLIFALKTYANKAPNTK